MLFTKIVMNIYFFHFFFLGYDISLCCQPFRIHVSMGSKMRRQAMSGVDFHWLFFVSLDDDVVPEDHFKGDPVMEVSIVMGHTSIAGWFI